MEGGLAGIGTRTGPTCPAPLVYTRTLPPTVTTTRPLTDYVTLDLTTPAEKPRLRSEVRDLIALTPTPCPITCSVG